MSTAEISWAVLGFISFLIPIVAALWKGFNVIASLRSELLQIRHDNAVENLRIDHLQQSLDLSINGVLERISHYTTRSRSESEKFDKRLGDLEGFLTKSTEFERRS